MSTKSREVIWGGAIMGAKMRAKAPVRTHRRPPERQIVLFVAAELS
jgi:hypothetical protein